MVLRLGKGGPGAVQLPLRVGDGGVEVLLQPQTPGLEVLGPPGALGADLGGLVPCGLEGDLGPLVGGHLDVPGGVPQALPGGGLRLQGAEFFLQGRLLFPDLGQGGGGVLQLGLGLGQALFQGGLGGGLRRLLPLGLS